MIGITRFIDCNGSGDSLVQHSCIGNGLHPPGHMVPQSEALQQGEGGGGLAGLCLAGGPLQVERRLLGGARGQQELLQVPLVTKSNIYIL